MSLNCKKKGKKWPKKEKGEKSTIDGVRELKVDHSEA